MTTLRGLFYIKKSKLTNEELIGVIKNYFNGKGGIITLAKKYGVHKSTIEKYLRIAKEIDSVVVTGHNRKYSKEFKIKAKELLENKSHRPHTPHPNSHTKQADLETHKKRVECKNTGIMGAC